MTLKHFRGGSDSSLYSYCVSTNIKQLINLTAVSKIENVASIFKKIVKIRKNFIFLENLHEKQLHYNYITIILALKIHIQELSSINTLTQHTNR